MELEKAKPNQPAPKPPDKGNYKTAPKDKEKPYPIKAQILASSRQSQKSYNDAKIRPDSKYEGGFYTQNLLKAMEKSDSFTEAHDKAEQRDWPNRRKYEDKEKTVRELRAKSPEYKTLSKLAKEKEKYVDNSMKERRVLSNKYFAAEAKASKDPQAKKQMESVELDIQKFQERFDKNYQQFKNRETPLQKALDKKMKPHQDELKQLEKKTLGDRGLQLPLPVRTQGDAIEGWKKKDTNPRTALLIEGADMEGTGKDIAAMKAKLIKDFGLKESDIHYADTPEKVKEAMAKMAEFGKANAGKNPAAMIYYSGHGLIDNDKKSLKDDKNKSLSLQDYGSRTDPEGADLGSLMLKDSKDRKQNQYLHEYAMKDNMKQYFKNFDGRTLMILDACFSGAWLAKHEEQNPFSRRWV